MRLMLSDNSEHRDLGELPKGDAGIASTIAAMQAVIDHAVFEDEVAQLLIDRVLAQLPAPTDVRGFGDGLFAWCKQTVRFERDPRGIEHVRLPRALLLAWSSNIPVRGDCDDLATLAASIIARAGLRPVLVTVGESPTGKFKHVFFGIRLAGELTRANVYPLDPQETGLPGVWPLAPRVRLWSLTVTPPR